LLAFGRASCYNCIISMGFGFAVDSTVWLGHGIRMATPHLDISDSFTWEEGLPHPQWDLINTWVKEHVPPDDRSEVWTDIASQWLRQLGGALGRGYQLGESDHFLLLAGQSLPNADLLLGFGERCRQRLVTVLAQVAAFRSPGKQVVLLLDTADAYYTYLSVYYPEGHHGGSAGVHVREGYQHVALWGKDLAVVENVLAHEMTHASLGYLSMPQWVEEGLAQMFEHDSTGRSLLQVDAEMASEHKRYWSNNGLDAFWRGEGFLRPGKVQKLSYQLAEILLRLLFEDFRPRWFGIDKGPRQRLLAFLKEADAIDCGAAAAQEHLGQGLSHLAGRFLGPGDWAPSL
jgi:hypothetical protein